METGTVKFFNNDRGFGFIEPSSGEKDVFVHASNVVNMGYKGLEDGQRVEFEVAQGAKGPEAQNVRTI
jgi:CspA family cold shock protein